SAIGDSRAGGRCNGEGLWPSHARGRAGPRARGRVCSASRSDVWCKVLQLFPEDWQWHATRHFLAYLCLAMIDLPVLFIHGFPFDSAMWRHQIAALSRWERIVPDLWGAGLVNIPATAGPYSIADQATSLVGMLDDLQVD